MEWVCKTLNIADSDYTAACTTGIESVYTWQVIVRVGTVNDRLNALGINSLGGYLKIQNFKGAFNREGV